jgi:hypothetical protein
MAIWILFFPSRSGEFEPFFFHGKSFVWVGRDHKFSGRNLAKFFPPQKKKKRKKKKPPFKLKFYL